MISYFMICFFNVASFDSGELRDFYKEFLTQIGDNGTKTVSISNKFSVSKYIIISSR